jgi:hypothetical protein
MKIFENLYATVFISFYKLGAGRFSAEYHVDFAKGIGGVTLVFGAIIFGLVNWIQIVTQQRCQLDSWVMWAGTLAIYFLNDYFLSSNGLGKSIEMEFRALPKAARIAKYRTAIILILLVVAWLSTSTVVYQRTFNIQ